MQPQNRRIPIVRAEAFATSVLRRALHHGDAARGDGHLTSKSRPSQLPLIPLPPPPSLRAANTTQPAATGHKQTVQTHSSRIERRAARGGGGREACGRSPGCSGGMGRDGSTCKMGRLKAPARDEPGIDQHQRRALRQYLREIGSDIKQCSAAGRLRVTKRRLNRSGR